MVAATAMVCRVPERRWLWGAMQEHVLREPTAVMRTYLIEVIIETTVPVYNPVQPSRPQSHFAQVLVARAQSMADAVLLASAAIEDAEIIHCTADRTGLEQLRDDIAEQARALSTPGVAWTSERAAR